MIRIYFVIRGNKLFPPEMSIPLSQPLRNTEDYHPPWNSQSVSTQCVTTGTSPLTYQCIPTATSLSTLGGSQVKSIGMYSDAATCDLLCQPSTVDSCQRAITYQMQGQMRLAETQLWDSSSPTKTAIINDLKHHVQTIQKQLPTLCKNVHVKHTPVKPEHTPHPIYQHIPEYSICDAAHTSCQKVAPQHLYHIQQDTQIM